MTDISKISIERINDLVDKLNEINTKFDTINSKLNSMKYVIESGSNSNGWYRKWSDGFIEQYGTFSLTVKTTDTQFSHTYPISFTNGDYQLQISIKGGWSTTRTFGTEGQGFTNFTGYVKQSTQTTVYINWYACGY